MASSIDPTKPLDGVPSVKTDLRANLAAAKSEIEALQGAVISVKNYGALGRGGSVHRDWTAPLTGSNECYAIVNAGTKTVTLRQEAGNTTKKHYFTAANVGDPIEIMYGGAPNGSDLITWIVSVTNATTVVLAHEARAAVTNVNVRAALRDQTLVTNYTSAGTMSLASRTLTVTGAAFDAYVHTGRYVRVTGAGSANLYTTIATFVNKNEVTVTATPNHNLAMTACIWGPDDGPAVRSAVAAIMAAGGGRLYFPAGVYKIVPPAWSGVSGDFSGCIEFGNLSTYVQLRGVEISGDGAGNSTIVCRCSSDRNPTNDAPFADWRALGAEAYRPGGIRFSGKANAAGSDNSVGNINIHDLEIDGGCYPGNTGNTAVTTFDLDNWDSGSQGISFVWDMPVSNVTIERCYVHNFRGEILYAGGSAFTHYNICHNRVGSSNGNCISVSLGFSNLSHNTLYDVSGSGSEDGPRGSAIYNGNHIYDMRTGMFIGQIDVASQLGNYPMINVTDNTFEKCWANGLQYAGGRGTISGNTFSDIGIVAISLLNGNVFVDDKYAVLVTGNNAHSTRYDGAMIGMSFDDSVGPLKATVTGNYFGDGAAAKGLQSPYSGVLGNANSEVRIYGNSIGRCAFECMLFGLSGNKLSAGQYMPTFIHQGDVRIGTSVIGKQFQTITLTNADKSFSAKYEVLYIECESGQIFLVPILDDTTRYKHGHRVQFLPVTGTARPVAFPWRGTHFSGPAERLLYPGTELTYAWDSAVSKFIETSWRDTRADSVTVTTGTVIAGQGTPTIILDSAGAVTYLTFTGIPEGDWTQCIVAPDANASIGNTSVFVTGTGGTITLTANVPTFWRRYGTTLVRIG